MSKKEKDREVLQKFLDMYRKYSDERLLKISGSGGGNKVAIQASNIVLKERGLK